MSQPKLALRPPPHRDFVQGYPGIPGSSTRPPAHLAGTVEVRLGTKGLKASWLRIELRKLEILPGGESWGELIGRGPIDVWSARKDEGYKSEDDKGWELLQTADFPFQVMIPEGLPPSAKLEKQAGIAYELVTSLCVQTKKGLLRKEVTSTVMQNTHPIVLEKHELHSSWPVYHFPDQHETASEENVRVKLFRSQTCYGPGDQVDVRIIVSSDRVTPIKLKTVSFSVRETITFRGGTRKTFGTKNAASQKTENLSSKSKSFGKKIYKGDVHTFDLSCSIPKTHTLMTIQTAKHIEVSYTIRVQVDLGKKPIVIDHLPLTLSSFVRNTSDVTIDRIGFVPGLSTAGQATDDGAPSVRSSSAGAPTITRSQSYAASSFNSPYAGYPASDLRRRDTVMSQGTTVSGPGMAGRGVPGQVFSWGQYGAAQPFGNIAPRPAFAGPPSIYEGRELAPEENRALFHSSNRPQSAFVLGGVVDPVYLSGSNPSRELSRFGNSERHVTAVMEGPEEQSGPNGVFQGPQRQRSLSNPIRSAKADQAASATFVQESGLIRPDPIRASLNSAEAEKELLYQRAREQAERNQRRADERRAQFGQGTIDPTVDYGQTSMIGLNHGQTHALSAGLSAADEKARLFERARAEAERYQSTYSQGAQFPPPSLDASDPASANSSRRASANYWLQEGGSSSSVAAPPVSSLASSAQQIDASSTSASGSLAPYPTYVSAEEEKRRLYERAKAETEAYQRGGQVQQTMSQAEAFADSEDDASRHQAAGSSSSAYASPPGAWPSQEPGLLASQISIAASTPPVTAPVLASATRDSATSASVPPLSSAVGEKEQLRRYYEAQDAVARHQANAHGEASVSSDSGALQGNGQANGGSASAWQNGQGLYAPEVAQAVMHATPHQPSDTLPSSRGALEEQADFFSSQPARSAGTDVRSLPQAQQHATSAGQSYLTEAEQQNAREKERLATHYAKKAARAEARAAAAAQGGGAHPTTENLNGPGALSTTHDSTGLIHLDGAATTPAMPASMARPTAGFANGSGEGRAVHAARRTPSVMGGRPLPGLANHSPSPSFSGSPVPPGYVSSAASEKAQLAAYYAAKDATEQAIRMQQQQQQQPQQLHTLSSAGIAPTASLSGSVLPSPSTESAPSANHKWESPSVEGTRFDLGSRPLSDDASSIYTEVLHDPEVLAGKKKARAPSIYSNGTFSASSSTTPFATRPASIVHPSPPGLDNPAAYHGSSSLYQGAPSASLLSSSSSPSSSATLRKASLRQPPAPIKRDDPSLWRPRYDWVEEDPDAEAELDGARPPPPPLPPKIPIGASRAA